MNKDTILFEKRSFDPFHPQIGTKGHEMAIFCEKVQIPPPLTQREKNILTPVLTQEFIKRHALIEKTYLTHKFGP